MEMQSFTRGELVWARVVYPHQWWPGLVLKTDIFGVLVSFFGYQKSRYFLESEISSFEQNFKTHIKNCTNKALLDCAFECLGQHVVLSLTSPGQVRKLGSGASPSFQPQRVLGFVRSVAIWPWVKDGDFVRAVNLFAQTTAFRHYLVNSSVNSKMQAGRASPEKINSVATELDNINMEHDCQVFSEEAGKNLPTSMTNRNTTNLLLAKSLRLGNEEQLDGNSMTQIKQQISPGEMLANLQFLAQDPFCLGGECLSTLKRRFLSFRDLSFLSISDTITKTCSSLERGEPQFSNLRNRTCWLGYNFYGAKEKTAPPLIPYLGSPVSCLSLKRQLDQCSVSEPPLKLCRTVSSSINGADICRSRKEHDVVLSDIFISAEGLSGLFKNFDSMPFSSNGAYDYIRENITGSETILFDSFSSGSRVKLMNQNLSSIAGESSTYICVSNIMDFVQNMLQVSLVKHASHRSTSSVNTQQLQVREAILKNNVPLVSYTNVAAENMLKFSAAQSVSDFAADDVTQGLRNNIFHSHFATGELKMLTSNGDDSTSVKSNTEVRANQSIGDRFKGNKKLLEPLASDSAFKSRVGKLSKVQTSFALSKSLHMKFPKDCSLPSKEELVKKFSPFGRVDPLRTKVYFHIGSARVVFLHQLDAVAAYEYAKRKKILFGKQNVKFWLDPFDDKRVSKTLFPSPEFNLKSCLRRSLPLAEEDKRCPRKVTFLMETSSS